LHDALPICFGSIATPEAPVATNTQASLVEVSPSTVMRLKETLVSCCIHCSSRGCGISASVAINASMVAIFGSIMPAPFDIPVMVIVRPLTCTCSQASLGWVSVVIIPSAACCQPSTLSLGTAAGIPLAKGANSNTSEITPVEKGNTSCTAQPVVSATNLQVATARCKPSAPVPALAMPVLTNKYFGVPCCKCCLANVTGAAQKRFWVNTAATELPCS